MSIELYTGFVGSGKSYCATRMACQVADAPLGQKWVIANFPISKRKKRFYLFRKYILRQKDDNLYTESRWIFKDNDSLTVDYLVEKSLEMGWNEKESSALIIFDEASIPFNSRTFQRKDRMDWIKFLSQSRKFGYDVVFITQDARMIDKQIRHLCEYEVVHKKMNNMFALSWLPISLFAQVRYWNGLNARHSKGSLRLVKYNKKIADRYDTLRLFDTDEKEQA